jgi:TM2 domain-containing membrane protein YozV
MQRKEGSMYWNGRRTAIIVGTDREWGGVDMEGNPVTVTVEVSECSKGVAFMCCLFLSPFGIHRFYTGKIWTGLMFLLLSSLCVPLSFFSLGVPLMIIGGIWWLIDLVVIGTGNFKDDKGRTLV